MPTDHDLLIEIRNDVKYMGERFDNAFGRIEVLELKAQDTVTKSALVWVIGLFAGIATMLAAVWDGYRHSG